MPNLSWNEIRNNAVLFARDWASAAREQADKQTFWNEFFHLFGLSRRLVASFEEPVQRLRGTYGFIDLLWKGTVLVEHKSSGSSLEAAETQAFEYIHDLQAVGRGDEIPRYILLSDFQRFALYDLEPDEQLDLPLFRNRRYSRREFPLAELADNVRLFAFIPGYQLATPNKPQDPLNLKAVELMASVHDTLKSGGFSGHDLMRFLVRVLFCMFAEKTGIFEPDAFRLFIENRTSVDGSNLGGQLTQLFATLDKPEDQRQKNLDEDLKRFPYVNGALFSERLDAPAFTGPMRQALLNAANYKWAQISPAIFGALFQEVMKPEERRKIGAHYTSERDILKVIHPLFLDKLREEFASIQQDRSGRRTGRLEEFRVKLTKLNFLDPACGCGNFLVVAYRELRALELEVLKAQHSTQQAFSLGEVNGFSQVNVHQFYGIEIDEWPARIAEVALWLMDHQSNLQILAAFGQPYLRLPLKESPHIHIENALRIDWNQVIPAEDCDYILGNPPFIGAKHLTELQRADRKLVFAMTKRSNILDYVACWYKVTVDFMHLNSKLAAAFVSTSSITQGEQVGAVWPQLFQSGLNVIFAHRTFAWKSEARKPAAVHCVIIGFALQTNETKLLYDYASPTSEPTASIVPRINAYLVDGPNITVNDRPRPAQDVPKLGIGNKPIDDGNYLFTPSERLAFIRLEPKSRPLFHRWLGADEFLYDTERWFLWVGESSPSLIASMPNVKARIDAVRKFREASKSKPTQDLAKTPARLHVENMPHTRYLLIPRHSSEYRDYIPMGFVSPEVFSGDANLIAADATLFTFGVLQSKMHMAWVKAVCGRLESRFRYSAGIVYNNYPWPENMSSVHQAKVERLAQDVLDARMLYPESNLAQLYDPSLMPSELIKAHQVLDRAVERCYRPEGFNSDRERVEYLLALYENRAAPLLPKAPKKRGRQGKNL